MAMQLTHKFTVPASIDRTWEEFNDLESVGGCFPGATVTSVEGDSFTGSVKVKLGPIALQYAGTGTITERDESAHRLLIKASGKDKRGNGTAGADVVATLSQSGDSTDVEVVTDLNITGKPAQFGRGVMQDVSDKLLNQFVACLEKKLGAAGEPAAEEPAVGIAGAAAPASNGSSSGGSTSPGPATSSGAAAGAAGAAPVSPIGAGSGSGAARTAAPSSGSSGAESEAIDLGATVLPVLAKTYWKQALGALLALLVLRRILGR